MFFVLDVGTVSATELTSSIEIPYHTSLNECIVKAKTDNPSYAIGSDIDCPQHLLDMRATGDIDIARYHTRGGYFPLEDKICFAVFSADPTSLLVKAQAATLKALKNLGIECAVQDTFWIHAYDRIRAGFSGPEEGGRQSVSFYITNPPEGFWDEFLPIYMEKMGYGDGVSNYKLAPAEQILWDTLKTIHASDDWILNRIR